MHYYTFNIGDYRRDTPHLTLLEHGIYRQLLDTYYLNEKPLCADHAFLMRTHSVRSADEVQAFENVLHDFFELTDDGYVHARCKRDIEQFQSKSEKAKQSAKARWQKEKQDENANAMRTHSEGNANHKPITNNHKPITNKENKARPAPFDAGALDLPDCVSSGQWALFVEHRKEIRKPMKQTTAKALLAKLVSMHNNGHDPNVALQNSIENGWQGVFEPKSQARRTSGINQSDLAELLGD